MFVRNVSEDTNENMLWFNIYVLSAAKHQNFIVNIVIKHAMFLGILKHTFCECILKKFNSKNCQPKIKNFRNIFKYNICGEFYFVFLTNNSTKQDEDQDATKLGFHVCLLCSLSVWLAGMTLFLPLA